MNIAVARQWLPVKHAPEWNAYLQQHGCALAVLADAARRRQIADAIASIVPSPDHRAVVGRRLPKRRSSLPQLLSLLEAQSRSEPLAVPHESSGTGKKRELFYAQGAYRDFVFEYLTPLIYVAPVHAVSFSGELGRSAKAAAMVHAGAQKALSFDMKSAFPNVRAEYIFDFYFERSEALGSERRDVAGLLTQLSTARYANGQNALATGTPFATPLFNRLIKPLDEIVAAVCDKHDFRYTRFTDDFIVSTTDTTMPDETLLSVLTVLLTKYPIPHGKVYLQTRGDYAPVIIHNYDVDGIFGYGITKYPRDEAALLKKGTVPPEQYLPSNWPRQFTDV